MTFTVCEFELERFGFMAFAPANTLHVHICCYLACSKRVFFRVGLWNSIVWKNRFVKKVRLGQSPHVQRPSARGTSVMHFAQRRTIFRATCIAYLIEFWSGWPKSRCKSGCAFDLFSISVFGSAMNFKTQNTKVVRSFCLWATIS